MLPGFRAAFGAPAIAMAATFLGFGAAVHAAGLGLGWAMASALLIYGMPGQLILLAAAGAPGGAILGAIAANARFLPMAVSLSPWLGGRATRWLALPFIAVTPWAGGMRALPGIPPHLRLRWFLGFAAGCWLVAGISNAIGYWLAPFLPAWLLAVLVFTNPLYFGLLLVADRGVPEARLAMLGGAAASPLVFVLPSAWGLLAAGVLGGSLAFWRAFGTRGSWRAFGTRGFWRAFGTRGFWRAFGTRGFWRAFGTRGSWRAFGTRGSWRAFGTRGFWRAFGTRGFWRALGKRGR